MSRPGRQTVQSFTSLYDQDASTGAFVVVPRSHKRHKQVTKRVYRARPDTPDEQQFLMLPGISLVADSIFCPLHDPVEDTALLVVFAPRTQPLSLIHI